MAREKAAATDGLGLNLCFDFRSKKSRNRDRRAWRNRERRTLSQFLPLGRTNRGRRRSARTTCLRPTERICLVGRSLTLSNLSRARNDSGSIPSTSHTFSKENGLWIPASAWNHR